MRRSDNSILASAVPLVCAFTLAMNVLQAEESTGKRVFSNWCSACHMDSPFAPGTIQLKQTRGPDYAVIEQRTDLSAALIRLRVRKGLAGMPSFRRTEISNQDLDALIDYLVRK